MKTVTPHRKDRLGMNTNIDWSSPRLLCIAGDFSKYDLHAVGQMQRNIELIRYAKYGDDLLALDLINRTSAFRDSRDIVISCHPLSSLSQCHGDFSTIAWACFKFHA